MSNKKMFSVRVEDRNNVHTRIKVYNYGGLSGVLVLNTSDAEEFMRRISTPSASLGRCVAGWDARGGPGGQRVRGVQVRDAGRCA